METFAFTTLNGVQFAALYIPAGTEHPFYPAQETDKALVDFYDTRYANRPGFTPIGQFTGGRYYVDTILGKDPYDGPGTGALVLDGGISAWTIDGGSMVNVREWLRGLETAYGRRIVPITPKAHPNIETAPATVLLVHGTIYDKATRIIAAATTKVAARPRAQLKRELDRLDGAIGVYALITGQRTGIPDVAPNVRRLEMPEDTRALIEQAREAVDALYKR